MSTDARPRRKDRTDGGPLTRVAWVLVGLAIIFLKADGIRLLVHDPRVAAGVIFGLAAGTALYRGKPVSFCVYAGIAVGVLSALRPWWAAIPVGLAAILVLILLCYLLGRWLNRREGDEARYGSGFWPADRR